MSAGVYGLVFGAAYGLVFGGEAVTPPVDAPPSGGGGSVMIRRTGLSRAPAYVRPAADCDPARERAAALAAQIRREDEALLEVLPALYFSILKP